MSSPKRPSNPPSQVDAPRTETASTADGPERRSTEGGERFPEARLPSGVKAGPVRSADPNTLKDHKAARFLPAMQRDEEGRFFEDVSANGVLVPLLLVDGKVFDGRHRRDAAIACSLEQVSVRDVELGDVSEEELVTSINLQSRQLTKSQKAMVGARLVELYQPDAQARIRSGRKADQDQVGKSVDKAGRLVGVSGKTIQAALKVVIRAIAELQDAVEAGTISVFAARKVAELFEDKVHDDYVRTLLAGQPAEVQKSVSRALKEKEAWDNFLADRNGQQVSIGAAELNLVVLFRSALDKRISTLQKLIEWVECETSTNDGSVPGRLLERDEIIASVQCAARLLQQARPFELCPYCEDDGWRGCDRCQGSGWLGEKESTQGTGCGASQTPRTTEVSSRFPGVDCSMLTEHVLPDGLNVHTGLLPHDLIPDDERFHAWWSLCPSERLKVRTRVGYKPIARYQQAYLRDYPFAGQVAEAIDLPDEFTWCMEWSKQICSAFNGQRGLLAS